VGEATGKPVPVLIEVDGGLHRGGRQPGEDLISFAGRIAALPGLRVDGVMSYFGHVYAVEDAAGREAFAAAECAFFARAADDLRVAGIQVRRASGGSTPAVHTAARLTGLTEVRSGNYIFYDATALKLGFARPEDCALRVVATVVSTPLPGRATIDAGTKTLTSDGGHGIRGFGYVVGHPDIEVAKLNEEHGFLTFDPQKTTLRVGDRIEIIPNHSCVLPNLCDAVAGVRGGRGVERVRIDARGCNV
jgi:D-serine deaminase-like pyridoxal phosphate-dependent protein